VPPLATIGASTAISMQAFRIQLHARGNMSLLQHNSDV